MQTDGGKLRMRRTTHCALGAIQKIRVVLLNDESPVLQYSTDSLADARRYEEQTSQSLSLDDHAQQIVLEDLSQCAQCDYRKRCLGI